MVHMSSWYDPYPRTATENYVGLSRRKKGSARLILDPWTHGDRSLTYAGDVEFGEAVTLDGNLVPDYYAAAALVRRLAEGRKKRSCRRTGGADLRNGRRQRAQECARASRPWRRWRAEHDRPIPDAHDRPYYLQSQPPGIAVVLGDMHWHVAPP